jgi:putative ABC transport system substrate-binding protein
MRRRDFISLVGGAAAWPFATRAQQAMPVIGFVDPGSTGVLPGQRPDIFLRTLREEGFIEGRSLAFDIRKADGRTDALPALMGELVQRHVALILASSPLAARTAKAATSTIPIVFGIGEDPIKEGIVTSFNQPGGNITGVTNFGNQLIPKRLELLRELVPGPRVFAMLVNPNNPNVEPDTNEALAVAGSLGIELRIFKAGNDADLATAFDAVSAERPGALLVGVDNVLFRQRRGLIVALASRHAVPAIYERRDFVEAGGLMSYGTDGIEDSRQLALCVARILKGTRPGDLPVMQASKFELVINLNAAKAMKMEIPTPILLRATEVIE